MKIKITILSILFIVGCGEPDLGNPEILDEILAEAMVAEKIQIRGKGNEKLAYALNAQTPFTGWTKVMYLNGQVKTLIQFEEGRMSKQIEWHENGQKSSQKIMQTPLSTRSGSVVRWYENGQKRKEGQYLNGAASGNWTSWYENGQKEEEWIYAPNREGLLPMREGVSTSWYENGNLESVTTYRNGNGWGPRKKWHENGYLKEEGSLTGEGIEAGLGWLFKRDGLWKFYDEDGNLEKTEEWEDGKIKGLQSAQTNARDTSAAFAKLGDRFTISDLGLEMLWVKHGTFMMGDKIIEQQHHVTLTKGFYLGKYEVTQAQWERVMGNNPSWFKGADRPVEEVSWNDAVEFCKKLTEIEKKAGRVPQGMSYQLPTEAQWEYACRAGTSTKYSWGDSISSANANYDENVDENVDETTPVGKYPANPWGFHDMHGNVWEWCSDWYGDYPSGSVTNPIGPASGSLRVLRGGCWGDGGADLRSAGRHGDTPSTRLYVMGFRVGFQSSM